MAFETIRYSLDDHVATITLDRPDRMNAWTATMMAELIAAIDLTDADDAVRAVIVTGAGRAFCAGADLGAGAATFDYALAGEDKPERADGTTDWNHPAVRDTAGQLTLRMLRSLKPLIGAINGAAVGVGVTMTLPMDFRLASDSARFGFVFTRRGIVPEGASSWFLPRLVGIANALDWTLTGRLFNADEALAAGLVRSVHAPDDLLPAATAIAREIADQCAPLSVAMTRQLMWRGIIADHPMAAHRQDSRAVYALGRQDDAREGVMSFLEKRPAQYRGSVSRNLPGFFPWWDEPDYFDPA